MAPKAAAPAAKPAAKAQAKTVAKAAAPAPKAAAPKPAAPAAAPKPAAAAAPKVEKKAAVTTSAANGVYVKNWGQGSVADATATFGAAGKVAKVQLRRGKYALVFFENAAAVKKAIDTFNGKEVNGTVVSVSAAKTAPKADAHEGSASVFVGPIFRESTTRKEIFELFAGLKVKKLRVYRQNHAFVFFENAAAAAKAMEKNGAEFHGKKLTVKPSVRSLESDRKRAAHTKTLVELHQWKKAQKA